MLPIFGLTTGLLLGVMACYYWHLKLGVLQLFLHQCTKKDTKLAIKELRFRFKYIVIKTTSLHDRPSSLHWNPNTQIHSKYLAEESTAHDVWLHCNHSVLHRKASLAALPVFLSMEQSLLVLIRLLGSIWAKCMLYSCSKEKAWLKTSHCWSCCLL